MIQINEELLHRAYTWWRRYYGNVDFEEQVEPFLDHKLSVQKGWLKNARNASQLTVSELARRLKITRSGYSEFEKNEMMGTITIRSLEKIAEAMDCELVYAIRPKNGARFSQIIWTQLKDHALKIFKTRRPATGSEATALAGVARDLFNNAQFRRTKGWSER